MSPNIPGGQLFDQRANSPGNPLLRAIPPNFCVLQPIVPIAKPQIGRRTAKSSFPRSAWERTASDAPRLLRRNRPVISPMDAERPTMRYDAERRNEGNNSSSESPSRKSAQGLTPIAKPVDLVTMRPRNLPHTGLLSSIGQSI